MLQKATMKIRLLVAIAIGFVFLVGHPTHAAKPNILLIITDQQYSRDIGAAGNPHVKTPAMDSLAARGMRFEASYCTYPLCSPARASLETSRMPHQLNIFNNGATIPENVQTIGEILRKSGYRTAWAGKWHLPVSYPGFGEAKSKPRGFDVLPLEGPKHRSNPAVGPGTGSDPATVQAAVKFLSETNAQPFLLTVSLLNPHDICDYPQAPEKYPKPGPGDTLPPLPRNFSAITNEPSLLQQDRERKTKGDSAFAKYGPKEWQVYRWVYYRLIERVDAHITTVLQALEKSGQKENTLVIFTSDHGEMGGAHQLATKMQMYEEAINVPLIVCPPGASYRRLVNTTNLVSGLDVLPTVCDYAGIAARSSFQGSSLRPLVEQRSRRARVPWREHVVVEMGDSNYVRMIRSDRFKYIVYSSGEAPEMFFDLSLDPHETRNLAQDPAFKNEIESLRGVLKAWIADTKDKFIFPNGI